MAFAGGGGDQKQKEKFRLTEEYRNAALRALAGAENLYGGYGEELPSTYVPISPERQAALEQMAAISETGGGVPGATVDEYLRTIGGEYLSPESNPYLAEVAERASVFGVHDFPTKPVEHDRLIHLIDRWLGSR